MELLHLYTCHAPTRWRHSFSKDRGSHHRELHLSSLSVWCEWVFNDIVHRYPQGARKYGSRYISLFIWLGHTCRREQLWRCQVRCKTVLIRKVMNFTENDSCRLVLTDWEVILYKHKFHVYFTKPPSRLKVWDYVQFITYLTLNSIQ